MFGRVDSVDRAAGSAPEEETRPDDATMMTSVAVVRLHPRIQSSIAVEPA